MISLVAMLALALPAWCDAAPGLARAAASFRPLPLSASAEEQQVLRYGWVGEHPVLEKHLQANEPALQAAVAALQDGTCRFLPGEPVLPYRLPDYARLQGMARALALRALLRASRGEDPVQDAVAALRLGAGLRQDPVAAAQVAGNRSQLAGLEALASWLAASGLPREELEPLAERLRALRSPAADLEAAVQQEVAAAKKLVADVARDPARADSMDDESVETLSRLGSGARQSAFVEFSRLVNGWANLLVRSSRAYDAAPARRVADEMEKARAARREGHGLSAPPAPLLAGELAAALLPDFQPSFVAAAEAHAWTEAVATLVQVRLFAARYGVLPQRLADAAPSAPAAATWQVQAAEGLLTVPSGDGGTLSFRVLGSLP